MKFPELFHAQADWIVKHKDDRKIAYVLHEGDIVNNNNEPQWDVAKAALSKLDGVVPYALAPGNHDYGPNGSADTRDTLLNQYFSADEHAKWPTFGGVFEKGKLDNSYHTLKIGDRDWIILALEWGPRNETVAWANEVLDKHPQHLGIVVTHAYLFSDGTRYDHTKAEKQSWNPHEYKTKQKGGSVNDGEELWQKLVKDRPQMRFALNGHVLNDGLGYLASEGAEKHTVHQILANYQMKEKGGEAYLRLMEFLPDGETVQVKSYSPALDQYKTDADNQFTLKLA
jgi:hypothetical protein